jgi:Flp pilus assembly pilin Flp
MSVLMKNMNRFILDEDGASATEYSVLIVMIILVALVAIAFLGEEVRDAFQRFVDLFEA